MSLLADEVVVFLVQNIACGFNQEAGELAVGCSSAQLSFRGARWHAGGALLHVLSP